MMVQRQPQTGTALSFDDEALTGSMVEGKIVNEIRFQQSGKQRILP